MFVWVSALMVSFVCSMSSFTKCNSFGLSDVLNKFTMLASRVEFVLVKLVHDLGKLFLLHRFLFVCHNSRFRFKYFVFDTGIVYVLLTIFYTEHTHSHGR